MAVRSPAAFAFLLATLITEIPKPVPARSENELREIAVAVLSGKLPDQHDRPNGGNA